MGISKREKGRMLPDKRVTTYFSLKEECNEKKPFFSPFVYFLESY